MTRQTTRAADWAGDVRSFTVFWGLPMLAFAAGALVDPFARTMLWTVALIWMGAACLANARRCGRTHCRYTGPFYLLLTIPVVLHGFGIVSLGPHGWWILAAVALLGGKLLWWATEAAWGRYA